MLQSQRGPDTNKCQDPPPGLHGEGSTYPMLEKTCVCCKKSGTQTIILNLKFSSFSVAWGDGADKQHMGMLTYQGH